MDEEKGHDLVLKSNATDAKKKEFEEDDCSISSSNSQKATWGKKADFLLSIIGFAVDLANVWRFPYLCYKNGGGAFLIPYFLMMIFGALPLFLMELCLGQYLREGPISVWKIAPIFKGIGVAECFIAYFVAFYYNVIIAWSFFYLFKSFTTKLPWTTCSHEWNTPNCTDGTNATSRNITGLMANETVSSAAEYFERGVLGIHESDGFEDMGPPRWQLFLCLLGVFVILYLALWKGVKSSGKVVWFTATMPYVVLLVLLIRGAFLPGAKEGILYFITPRVDRLGDPRVWIDAAIQIFYSCGAGFGVHLAYSSYNKFHNNCYRDCIITACVNSFTSLFSGFVIFMYLGYMAQRQEIDIGKVAQEGPGLVFIVYPEAIATLPGSFGWAIIFFIMLLTLGLDSAMGGLEAVLTGIQDEFKPFFKKYRFSREILTGIIIMGAVVFALSNITNGGMYMFTIWDTFAAGTSILFVVFCQAVAVSWIYGIDEFSTNIERMIGFRPNIYWRLCWKFIGPVFLFVVIISSIVSFQPLTYKTSYSEYIYPGWANAIGWCIAAFSMIMVPGVALYQFFKAPGSIKQRIALCISPVWEHSAIKRGKPVKRFKKEHWLQI